MLTDIALNMGVKVLGFDPSLSIDTAWRLSNEVNRMKIFRHHWSELTIFLYMSRRWMRPGI